MTKFWFSGGNQKDERPNESYYYGTYAYNTSFYEQNLDILDSAEGWIGSVVDLARFLVHVDGKDVKPDIIEKTHFDTMTTPSEVSPNPYNYAKGLLPNKISPVCTLLVKECLNSKVGWLTAKDFGCMEAFLVQGQVLPFPEGLMEFHGCF